jgi:hypothetical protein
LLAAATTAVLGLILHKARGGAAPTPAAVARQAVDPGEHHYRRGGQPVTWSRFLRQP